ncbi:MAG: DNA polymerase IV [Dehalococcoidia bacterium]|nr:DNA polymerase IV [Dehalococcoidia bacterium]
MTRRILHIDLDAFFVSVEQVLNPELRGKPVVVGGHPDSRGVVACASYEARAFGLHAAMPIATARRLCPQAIFLSGNFATYRKYSTKFFEILADFSPDIEPGGLDEAYIDMTGFEPLYGPTRETALKIKGRLRNELGLVASIGIASGKVIAKVASDFSKPDGLIEIAPGEQRAFLAPLPVKRLPGVGPKMQQVLKRIGVITIGQLAELPVSLLKKTCGVYGESLHLHANGIDESDVMAPGPAKSISREVTLQKDTLDDRLLKATLRYLTERVGADLRSQGKQSKCVTLKLRYADFDTITRSQTMKVASGVDQVIFEVGVGLLEKTLAQRRYPVRLIGIRVSSLATEASQLNMLDNSAERLVYLNKAIDRIRQKYGFGAIETGRTLPLREDFPSKTYVVE